MLQEAKDYSYKTFRKYLNMVFMYAGTASLSKELRTVPYTSLQAGDVFIKGGSPGHAVIVVDVAIHPKTKESFYWRKVICPPSKYISSSILPTEICHLGMN